MHLMSLCHLRMQAKCNNIWMKYRKKKKLLRYTLWLDIQPWALGLTTVYPKKINAGSICSYFPKQIIHKLLDSLRLFPLVVGESLHLPILFPTLLKDPESICLCLSLWAILVRTLSSLYMSFPPSLFLFTFFSSLSLLANARTSLVASYFIRICQHLQKVIFEVKCALASSADQQKKTCREKDLVLRYGCLC